MPQALPNSADPQRGLQGADWRYDYRRRAGFALSHERRFRGVNDQSGLPSTPERLRRCSESTLRIKSRLRAFWVPDLLDASAVRYYFFLLEPKAGCHPPVFWLGAAAIVLIFSFLGFLASRLPFWLPLAIADFFLALMMTQWLSR